MTKIGETFIVSSSFSYHFALEMQNKTGVEVPIGCPICEGVHDTDFVNNRCIRDIPAELQFYAEKLYADINNKIAQITNMLPWELESLSKGGIQKKGLFEGVGRLLAYVTGIATESDLTRLEQRLRILESFVFDNHDSSRTQLGHLLVVERLFAHRVDVILEDFKTNAHEVGLHMQLLIARTEGVGREVN